MGPMANNIMNNTRTMASQHDVDVTTSVLSLGANNGLLGSK
jgi:hypothetical protein